MMEVPAPAIRKTARSSWISWRVTARAGDVLAYFDRSGTSNAQKEAVNGRRNTYAAPHSASATSPTTSPDRYSTPAASDPNYTVLR